MTLPRRFARSKTMPIQERYIDSDGTPTDGSLKISLQNRAFRYGDGLFETIVVRDGRPIALDLHLQRLLEGAKILNLEPHDARLQAQASEVVEKLLKGQGHSGFGRMRITAYRADGGTYLPISDASQLVGEIRPLPTDPWATQAPRSVCTASTRVLHSPLSPAKTLNALPYILAARHATRLGYDDAMLLNHLGEVAELTASNIFLMRDGSLHTPHLPSGCLPGTMRARALAAAQALGIPMQERPIAVQDFQSATEVFCSNAIQGLQPIACIDHLQLPQGGWCGLLMKEILAMEV
jgi:branched-chain amino acid aminotransferase